MDSVVPKTQQIHGGDKQLTVYYMSINKTSSIIFQFVNTLNI